MGILKVARRDGGRSAQLTRRAPRALATLVAASVALLLAVAAPIAAHAEPEPTPPALDAVAPPAITSPASGAFIGSASAVISGTKEAGSEIQVLAGSSRTNVCTVDGPDTTFTCDVSRLPSGPSIPLTAVQLVDGRPNVESAPVNVDILAAPTIAGSALHLTNGLVQGAGYPDATITLSIGGDSTWRFPAGPDGTWAYVLPRSIGSGPLSLTATQSTSFSQGRQSDRSPAQRVLLDVDPPSAPRLTSPPAGSTVASSGTVYSGTGEDTARVEVFAVTASGADVAVCSAVVSRGGWSCTGGALPAGMITVTAFQKDAAGNVGGGSIPLEVRVADPASPSSSPSPTQTETEAPVPAPVVPTAPPSPAPTPSESAPALPDIAEADPGEWAAATPFTSGVPSALGVDDLSWLRAVLLAAVAILLLLVPARMLATTAGGRTVPRTAVSLTGRNRVPTHDDPAPLVAASPGALVITGLVVVAAGGIVLFANPVHGQPEYLRVFLASVIAISLLNVAATLLPRLLAPRLAGAQARIAVAPWLLIAVAGVALTSRLLDLQPALLFGVVFTVGIVAGARSSRGILALLRIGVVFVFGLLAWLFSTLLGTPSGFVDVLATEVANIAAVAGVGSAAVLLVPLGRSDGRALLVWSRPAWFASAVVVLTVLFALLAPVVDVWQNSGGGILVVLFVLMLFGALGFSVWLWRRVIQPSLTSD